MTDDIPSSETLRHRLPRLPGRLGSGPVHASGPPATIIRDLPSLLTSFVFLSAVVR